MTKKSDFMDKSILTINEAATWSGCARSTFNRKAKELHIPKINRGGKTYFDIKVLEEFFPTKLKNNGLATVVSLANQKGGVGKSSISLGLGFALHDLGYKVLVIDFDPQGNVSKQFLNTDPDELKLTIINLLDSKNKLFEKALFDKVVHKTNKFDLVPANTRLALFNNDEGFNAYKKLKNFIKTIKGIYHYIIIDCPPTLDIKLLNALNASDITIVPSHASKFATDGLQDLKNTIMEVKEENETLRAYTVMNQIEKNRKMNIILDSIKNVFPMLACQIPKAADIEQAQLSTEHIYSYSPKHYQHYIKLAKEVVEL
jgi:chromosome partitioning protein